MKIGTSVIFFVLLLFACCPLMGTQNIVPEAHSTFAGKSLVAVQKSPVRSRNVQAPETLHLPACPGETINIPTWRARAGTSRVSALLLLTDMSCKGFSSILFKSEAIPENDGTLLHRQYLSFPHHHFW